MSTGTGIDEALKKGLGAAKEGRVNFAAVGTDAKTASVFVSKATIPPALITVAKKTAGNATVTGVCYMQDGELLIEVEKEPSGVMTDVVKKATKRLAGVSINPRFVTVAPINVDLPPLPDTPRQDGQPKGPVVGTGQDGGQSQQPKPSTDQKKPQSKEAPTRSRYSTAKMWADSLEAIRSKTDPLQTKLTAYDNLLKQLLAEEQMLKQDTGIGNDQRKVEELIFATAKANIVAARKAEPAAAARRDQAGRDTIATNRRRQMATKSTVVAKKVNEIQAAVKNFTIPLTVAQLDQIETATSAGESGLKSVTSAARIMVAHIADTKSGKVTGESTQAIINKVREEATKYVNDHKNPHTKVGKDRVAAAQVLIKQADAAAAAVNEQMRQMQTVATVVEGLITANQVDGRAIESMRTLLKSPLLTDKLRASYDDILRKGVAQLTARAQPVLTNPTSTEADKAQMLLECGGCKPPAEKGQSDSFFINGTDGKPAYIFKSVQGEARPSLDMPQGGGTAREVMASKLNDVFKNRLRLDLGVLPTVPVTLEDESFKLGSKSRESKRTGSLQKAVQLTPGEPMDAKQLADVPDKAELSRRMKAIPKDNVDKLILLDFITLNADRHANNLLMEGTAANPILRPIDAGQMLPNPEFFKSSADAMAPLSGWNDANPSIAVQGQNFLLQLPQAQQPFSDAIKQQIAQMDPDAMIADLKDGYREMAEESPDLDGTVDLDSFDLMRKSMLFLKQAAQTLTPYQIGRIYADGFEGILAATNDQELDREIKAVIAAAKVIQAQVAQRNASSEDRAIEIQFNAVPPVVLTTKQKAQILQNNLDLQSFQQLHFVELQRELVDIDQYIVDTVPKRTTELTRPYDDATYKTLVGWSKYKKYGGDPKLKLLLAGDDACYALEAARPVKDKEEESLKYGAEMIKFGGFAEMQRVMDPAAYAPLRGQKVINQVVAFEKYLKKHATV